MIQGGKFDELFFRIRNAKTQKTWLSEEASIRQEIMVEEERKMEAMGAAPGESGASGTGHGSQNQLQPLYSKYKASK